MTRPWSVHVGDCRHTLAAMPEESIDAVVTDTPYGLSTLLDPPNLDRDALWQKLTAGQREAPIRTLMRSWLDTDENPVMKGRGFMGKEWDALVPPPATWRKVWRVLKPGAYCLAFAGTRTYDLITMALRFADFEIEDTWQWLYGCLSEDTEIMVNGEWRPWTDAVAGSTVMAYSLTDDTLRPETVEELFVYEYDDVAFHVRGDDTDHIVSRNHRCLINDGEWRFAVAEKVPRSCRIPVVEGDAVLRSVWRGNAEVGVSREAHQDADMFAGMQRQIQGSGVRQACAQGARCVDDDIGAIVPPEDVGATEPRMARRSDAASLTRQLPRREVRADAAGHDADVDQDRLHHGAPHGDGETSRTHADTDGSRAPHQPQPVGQPTGELDAVRHEPGAQAVRGARLSTASMATVTPIHYRGKVWCVRVPSGAFVARRNGQVFITGNSGMPKRVRLDLKIDEHFGMKDARPVLGKMSAPNRNNNGQTMGDGWQEAPDLFGAATPEAARFVGWDRASRPGWEPIIVAVKPLRGTIAETALRYGTGGMNADGCRIPRGDAGEQVATKGASSRDLFRHADGHGQPVVIDKRGGFPANVIIDEEVAAELDRLTGPCGGAGRASGPAINGARDGTAAYGARGGIPAERVVFHGRCDGASNFFYTAKASTSERDKGLEDLPTLTPGERSGGREEGSAGINGYAGTRGENGRNPHPTVKPISLMRYLVRRASPPGAWDPDMAKRPVVLDCFMGSGSTGVAAMVEGVRFVGCELGEESAEVARLRLQHAYALPREDGEAPVVTRVGGQGKLF